MQEIGDPFDGHSSVSSTPALGASAGLNAHVSYCE
jgi:hypothetical protein